MNQLEFEREKQRRVQRIKKKLEMVKSGSMEQTLELELRLAERQTFEETETDRRFIVN